jgi:hypothetical protein
MRAHTYFISYIIPNMGGNSSKLGFGNSILVTRTRKAKLVAEAIKVTTEDEPNAIVMNICKLD